MAGRWRARECGRNAWPLVSTERCSGRCMAASQNRMAVENEAFCWPAPPNGRGKTSRALQLPNSDKAPKTCRIDSPPCCGPLLAQMPRREIISTRARDSHTPSDRKNVPIITTYPWSCSVVALINCNDLDGPDVVSRLLLCQLHPSDAAQDGSS